MRQERARKSVKESQKRGDQKIEDHANERSSSLFNRNTNALRNTSLIDYNYSVPNLKQQLRLKYIGRACIQPDENKKKSRSSINLSILKMNGALFSSCYNFR